jgi:uncharacterized protein with HEPN domain
MLPREINYLLDVLEAARLLQMFVEDVDWDTFEKDLMRRAAVMRQLEIMGEAARRLSEETRLELSEIPWRQIIGMRNRLIHGYDDVDLAIVWDSVQNDLPPLIAQLEQVVPTEE